MFKTKFKNVEELRSFLTTLDCGKEIKFCVEPDYINAIVGISDDNKVVYDYDNMVEHLAKIYQEEGQNIDDATNNAVEWIDYNCCLPYWHILYNDIESDMPTALKDYPKIILGWLETGELAIDSEYINAGNISEIDNILTENHIHYLII